jgi:aspartate carbamoyltransferase catalytic subunit
MILNSQNQSNRLLSINDLSFLDISRIIQVAQTRDFLIKNEGTFLSVFFEHSTRTLLSFEKAAINCGLNIMRFDANTSSLSKEESQINTLRTLNSLNPSCIAVRCKYSLEPKLYSKYINSNIAFVNAGDGINEHPTQALLDLFTLLEELNINFSEDCLKNLKIAIMGDVMHSRVARSNIFLLSRLGAKIDLITPPNFLNKNFVDFYSTKYKVNVLHSYTKQYDVVMLLRVQKERAEGSAKICYPSNFGIYFEADLKSAYLMHPGPVNIGVEVSEEVAYNSKKSLISKQVENGVLVRSAILKFLLSK